MEVEQNKELSIATADLSNRTSVSVSELVAAISQLTERIEIMGKQQDKSLIEIIKTVTESLRVIKDLKTRIQELENRCNVVERDIETLFHGDDG